MNGRDGWYATSLFPPLSGAKTRFHTGISFLLGRSKKVLYDILIDNFETDPMVTYRYENSFGSFLSINASLSTGSPILADTEGVIPQEIIFDRKIAYWWEKDELCYLVW